MYIILPSNRNERFTEALWETWYARVHFYVIKFWTVPHGSPKSIQIWWLIIISPLELPFGYPSFPDKVTTAGPNDWGAAAVGWGRDKARPLGDFPVSFHLKMDVSNGILNGISWDFSMGFWASIIFRWSLPPWPQEAGLARASGKMGSALEIQRTGRMW